MIRKEGTRQGRGHHVIKSQGPRRKVRLVDWAARKLLSSSGEERAEIRLCPQNIGQVEETGKKDCAKTETVTMGPTSSERTEPGGGRPLS